MEVVSGASESSVAGERPGTDFYLVRRVAAVTGRDLRSARSTLDENSRPAISFSLTNEGSQKFGRVTGENVGRQLAIILDGRVQSAPRIDERITGEGRITASPAASHRRKPRIWPSSFGRVRFRPRSPISRNARSDRVSAPTRSGPASRPRSADWPSWRSSCWSSTSWRV
jgi:hypothetical protein